MLGTRNLESFSTRMFWEQQARRGDRISNYLGVELIFVVVVYGCCFFGVQVRFSSVVQPVTAEVARQMNEYSSIGVSR